MSVHPSGSSQFPAFDEFAKLRHELRAQLQHPLIDFDDHVGGWRHPAKAAAKRFGRG